MSTTMRMKITGIGCAIAATLAGVHGSPAWAGSHLWRFNEIFSNADGSIQFIEMEECCGAGNETNLDDKWVKSDATGNTFTFTANLPCTNCTANKFLLLATQSFADLPGAPKPDYIIEPDFFSLGNETLRYWLYTPATWSIHANTVPTDGVNSLDRDGTTGVNSPTNFAGDTGSVTLSCDPADLMADGAIDVDDLLAVINAWGPCADCPADFVPDGGDGQVNVDDLLGVINAWGPCK